MKIFKKALAVALSATIMTSTVAVGGFSALANDNLIKNNVSDSLLERCKTENKKNNGTKDYVEGEAVVMLKDTGLVSTGASLEESIGVSDEIQVDSVKNFSDKRDGFSVATVSSDELSTEQMIEKLNKSDDVLIAEPNYICKTMSITDDTYSDFQWSLDNKGQNAGKENADINPQDLWAKPDTTTKENVVAIIDSGVDYTHEDLKDKMWVNPYQKYLKGVHGLDVFSENIDFSPMDNNGHGTHCAGIIAAQSDNNKGISGVSRNTKIMAVKAFDTDGYGDLEACIAAYNYVYRAMRLGVNVVAINDSWGFEEDSKILTELINKVGELGAVSVCAAGNSSTDFSEEINYEEEYSYDDDDYLYSKGSKLSKDVPDGYYMNYPAMSDSKYIITVAATGENGKLAAYSDYGKDTVDVAAPGSDILSSVSYNNFLPNIYTDTDSKCSTYLTKDFNAKEGNLKSGDGQVVVTETTEDYFSDTTDNKTSLNIDINNVSEQEYYSVEIPYTAEASEKNPYFSMMLKIKNLPKTDDDLLMMGGINQMIISDFPADKEVTENDMDMQITGSLVETGDDWIHISGKLPNKNGGKRKLVLTFVNYGVGNYSLQFDNIGISKGTAKEEDSFGKYDYYSGTSMATPAVTGAIALLMEKDNTLTAEKATEKIKHSVTQSDDLVNKTIYGGYVDLSKIDSPVPHIDEVKLVNSKPTICGSQFNNSTVYVDDKAVSSTYNSKDGSITINDNSVLNKTTVVTVKNDFGKSVQKTVLLTGTAYQEMGIATRGFESFSGNVSDGKNIYVLSDYGTIEKYTPNSSNILNSSQTYNTKKLLETHFKNYINGAPYEIETYSPVYASGYIYFVVDCNLTTSSVDYYPEVTYASQSAFVKMNVSTGKMSYTAINSSLLHPTVAVYNDTPYLVGGYDTSTDSLSNAMYKYSSGKWSMVSSLPKGRAYGKCVQVGTKLIYTMGTDGTENVPQNLIYNGKTWTESKAPTLKTFTSNKVEVADQKFTYYECGVDLISGGLLYTGVIFEGMGDTVKYTVSTDSFASLNKYFHTDSVNHIKGVVVNNKYYGTYYDVCEVSEYDYPDYDIDDLYDPDDYPQTDEEESKKKQIKPINATFGVSSGMYTIKANAPHGRVSGTGVYAPGSKVTITASANKGFKVKSIYVNGKTYNTNKVTFTATKNLTVKVYYISYVTKIKLNKTIQILKQGKKFTLRATVTPTTATNKAVSWSTSNKKIATVNSKGLVTAKSKGSCIIKATAKDGSRVSASCKIKVVKK